jgi:hypothetical protein
MRVDSGSGWKGGSFSRFYKMFHFVEYGDGRGGLFSLRGFETPPPLVPQYCQFIFQNIAGGLTLLALYV